MYINYDISEIIENEDGITIEVRFFEGDYQDVETTNKDGELETINQYIRTSFLYNIRKTFSVGTTQEEWSLWFTDIMQKDGERTPLWN
jgi:hypothetical protein